MEADFPRLLREIERAFVSRPDTIVVPGAAMGQAMDLILTPRIRAMMQARQSISDTAK
jgi:phosphoribulokinase